MLGGLLGMAQPGGEAVAKERHQSEHMVGRATRIGIMLFDRQPGMVIQQAVEDIGGLACGRGDHARAERVILVRDMGVERYARFVAVARVDVADRGTPPACVELLTVARRPDAAAPSSGNLSCASRVYPPSPPSPLRGLALIQLL